MDNLIGLTLGNFQIIELIGRGGMSSVYLAADKALERSVALKVPHTRYIDNPSFVKRFRREAKAMARLRHPNVVQIYSVGNHGEMPFFAMEYIQGEPLSETIKEAGRLSTDVALDYITQIGRAVEYAHEMDVVHRDIKPANIIIDTSGRALVTDFGVSKMLSDETTQETMGFVGTPQYMSPEQCGEGTLDHRTDIYSLGAVLFEMLTGVPPFVADSPAETIKKQLFETPEFPDEFKKTIPEKIQAIVTKTLEKKPEDRYPNIPAFLKELENLDKECAEPTLGEEEEKPSRGKRARSTQDFISHVNGHRTRWPKVVLASLVAVGLLAFSASFILSNGAGFRLETMTSLFSREESPNLSPFDSAAQASAEPLEPITDPQPSRPAVPPFNEPAGKPEIMNVISTKPEVEIAGGKQWANTVIDSKPQGADIFLDSEPRGKTPLTLPEITAGTHMLAMELEGYPDHSGEVLAEGSRPLEVFHDFTAAKAALTPKGSLSIDSEPSGAAVYVNGKRKGETPLELSELHSDDYTIELRLDDYENMQKEIKLQPDENLRISLNLVEKPKFGDLSIGSQPEGAEVLLNGAYKGDTPLVLRRLPVGKYELLLKKEGYEPIREEVVCRKNMMRNLEASLKMTPRFAALHKAAAGDTCTQTGDFAGAIAAYELALSLDSQTQAYSQKLSHARRSLLVEHVQDLLSSYKFAYEGENTALLASLLNQGDADLLADQISNAEKLFHEFDNIALALSDIQVGPDNEGEVVLQLHLTINAAFAETGVPVPLLDSDQILTLRKNTEDSWKICAIQ